MAQGTAAQGTLSTGPDVESIFQQLPEDFRNNTLWCNIASFAQSAQLLCTRDSVTVVRVIVQLLDKQSYDLAVKFWPEDRARLCFEQTAAAGRASAVLDGPLCLTETTTMRVIGHGIVSVSQYGGPSFQDIVDSGELSRLAQPEKEQTLRRFLAHMLLAHYHLEILPESDGGPHTCRDLKPSNVVVDVARQRYQLTDFGGFTPKDFISFDICSFDHMPVDLTAINPSDGQAYCMSRSGLLDVCAAVSRSNASGLDSNLLGITALRILSAMQDSNLMLVDYFDPRYQVSAGEAASLDSQRLHDLKADKLAQFASEYRSFMSDTVTLRQLLSGALSQSGVSFLMDLLEVNPHRRSSIQQAKQHPWIKGTVDQVIQEIVGSMADDDSVRRYYEDFPVALQLALQQRQAQQHHEAAVAARKQQDIELQAADLQQQLEQLQKEHVLLQQHLTKATVIAPAAAMMERSNSVDDETQLVSSPSAQQPIAAVTQPSLHVSTAQSVLLPKKIQQGGGSTSVSISGSSAGGPAAMRIQTSSSRARRSSSSCYGSSSDCDSISAQAPLTPVLHGEGKNSQQSALLGTRISSSGSSSTADTSHGDQLHTPVTAGVLKIKRSFMLRGKRLLAKLSRSSTMSSSSGSGSVSAQAPPIPVLNEEEKNSQQSAMLGTRISSSGSSSTADTADGDQLHTPVTAGVLKIKRSFVLRGKQLLAKLSRSSSMRSSSDSAITATKGPGKYKDSNALGEVHGPCSAGGCRATAVAAAAKVQRWFDEEPTAVIVPGLCGLRWFTR